MLNTMLRLLQSSKFDSNGEEILVERSKDSDGSLYQLDQSKKMIAREESTVAEQ